MVAGTAPRARRRPQTVRPVTSSASPDSERGEITRHARRGDIQGLRALAVLLVIAFHAGLPVPGGFIGVDVFFAISGFVITQMLLTELDRTGSIDLLRFYGRRAKRLLPALAVMVGSVALLATLAAPAASQWATGRTGIAASLFGANIELSNRQAGYFDVGASLDPFLHTWTLAVEEQFYLFFPVVLLVGWYAGRRLRLSRAVVTAGVLATCVCSLAISFLLSGGGLVADADFAGRLAFYAAPARAWEFGAGALVALLAPLAVRLSPSARAVLGIGGIAAVGLAAGRAEANELLPVLGSCVLLAAGCGATLGVGRALSLRPVVWVGDRSYSLYLWHWPLIVFAGALWPGARWAAPFAAVVSVVPAWLSYRYVENPTRFNPRLVGRRVVVLAAACVGIPVLASGALLLATGALGRTGQMETWKRGAALHADVVRGCDRSATVDVRRCTWSVPGSVGNVVLYGDSNAGQFTEPVARAANRAGLDFTVTTYSSCPPVGLRVERVSGELGACPGFGLQTLQRLISSRPSLVVIAARTDKYLEDSSIGLAASGGLMTHDPAAKARLWQRALSAMLERLDAAGVPVLLVHPVPSVPPMPEQCAVLRILLERCGSSAPRDAADERLARAIRVEREAVTGAPTARALDLTDVLCPDRLCVSSRAGIPIYRDAQHLSVDGALELTDLFSRAIRAHARSS
ncbi:MAG: acyltransferase family protein [Actinomycetota bacterium]